MTHSKGFTLAELLIALAILGVIATFAIPKVLQAQQDERSKAIAKEAAGTISAAYSAYQLSNSQTPSLRPVDLIPYINYVRYDTASTIDNFQTAGTETCAAVRPCLHLHNGAVLMAYSDSFAGTGSTNAIMFLLDPDGQASNTKAVKFALYYNGRLTTRAQVLPGTTDSSGGTFNPGAGLDPPWFSWN